MSATQYRFSNQQRYIAWQNTHLEQCPTFGCIEVAGFEYSAQTGEPVVQGTRPTSGGKIYAFNRLGSVYAEASGELTFDTPALAVLDDGDAGDTVGPVNDSWSLSTEGKGYLLIERKPDGIGLVVSTSPGSGGGNWIYANATEDFGTIGQAVGLAEHDSLLLDGNPSHQPPYAYNDLFDIGLFGDRLLLFSPDGQRWSIIRPEFKGVIGGVSETVIQPENSGIVNIGGGRSILGWLIGVHGGQAISQGKNVLLLGSAGFGSQLNEARWRVIAADCESET